MGRFACVVFVNVHVVMRHLVPGWGVEGGGSRLVPEGVDRGFINVYIWLHDIPWLASGLTEERGGGMGSPR